MKSKFLVFLLFLAIMPISFAANSVVPVKKSVIVQKKPTPPKAQLKPVQKTINAKKIPAKTTNLKSLNVVFSPKLPKKSVSLGVSKTNTIPVQMIPVLSAKTPITSAPKDSPEIPVKVKTVKKHSQCIIKNPPPAALPSAVESTELRKIAKEAALELQDEETVILGDLRILWQYAVENSETIKFAIYKLSDPKGDLKNADESKIKKLLKPIAGITPFVAAASACNPIAAGTSIVGGTFMNDILSEDKYKKHLEKVTDADLVILAKAIEDLQNNLVTTYYEYVTAKKILIFADNNLQNRRHLCDSLTNVPEETVVIADTFYREALARQNQAQSNLLLKRAALEQLVGNDAILLIESNKNPNK